VKQIRIPRPKYCSSSSTNVLKCGLNVPKDPPKDYDLQLDLTKNCRQETQKTQIIMDEMQRAFQEKL